MLPAFVLMCLLNIITTEGLLSDCIESPRYVTPNDTTVCTCSKSFKPFVGQWYICWKDPSGGVVAKSAVATTEADLTLPLTADLIPREADGYGFTCYMVYGSSQLALGTYTPHLAYGPENVTVTGTKSVRPAEKSNVTLTCTAKVNPPPTFHWQGHPEKSIVRSGCSCDNFTFSETVTFDPDLYNDGDVIKCTVTNSAVEWPVSKEEVITMQTGPQHLPEVNPTPYVIAIVTLGILLMTSVALLIRQRRALHNRNLPCAGTVDSRPQVTGQSRGLPRQGNSRRNGGSEDTRRKRSEFQRRRQSERERLLNFSINGYDSASSGNPRFLCPENPSLQSSGEFDSVSE